LEEDLDDGHLPSEGCHMQGLPPPLVGFDMHPSLQIRGGREELQDAGGGSVMSPGLFTCSSHGLHHLRCRLNYDCGWELWGALSGAAPQRLA
jgi:hypothetical protein